MINQNRSTRRGLWVAITVGGCLLFVLLCACAVVAVAAGLIVYQAQQPTVTVTLTSTLTATPAPPTLDPSATPAAAITMTPSVAPSSVPLVITPPVEVDQRPIAPIYDQTLALLWQTNYPAHDYYELARRFQVAGVDEPTVTAPVYVVGDTQSFFVDDQTIVAKLAYVSTHAYFWMEDGLKVPSSQVGVVAERFERDYYPSLVDIFGIPLTPGVDNDPHFSVLHIQSSGSDGELGFFYSGDEYPRVLEPFSNQQEMIYLNMALLDFGDELYFGTLVHEYVHLAHWRADPNESSWLDEGLAQLSETYLGLDTVDTAVDYQLNPDTQLNTWSYDGNDDEVYAHYGASYLFALYLYEQLGITAIHDLVAYEGDSLAGVRVILHQYRPDVTLEQFMADWFMANYLDNQRLYNEQTKFAYGYEATVLRQPMITAQMIGDSLTQLNEAHQYTAQYIDLDATGLITVTFAGDSVVEMISHPPHSGDMMWFVPPVNDVAATLTAAFDLRRATEATLNFWAWYDLEPDWDYAYVAVSTDGGNYWEFLPLRHGTTSELGEGFTGRSQSASDQLKGWVPEVIHLKQYLGQEILLQFMVVTDSGVLGRGFAVDDISLVGLSYQNDVEQDDGVWQSNGFVRGSWLIPQTWAVQLITYQNRTAVVTPLPLDALNQGGWTLTLGDRGGVLVITPLTPYTEETATYWLSLEKAR